MENLQVNNQVALGCHYNANEIANKDLKCIFRQDDNYSLFPHRPGHGLPHVRIPGHKPGFPGHRPGFPGHRPGFPGLIRPGFPGHRPGFPGLIRPGFPGLIRPGFPGLKPALGNKVNVGHAIGKGFLGAIVGGLLLGPIGAIAGGIIGAVDGANDKQYIGNANENVQYLQEQQVYQA